MFAKLCSLKNKKGFTLIEMLVVIAIIAVLVAIIIPVVTSATAKASAATNAANLRSVKAEVATAYLTDDSTLYTFTKDASGVVTAVAAVTPDNLPKSKAVGGLAKDVVPSIVYNATTKDFDVTYGTNTIAMFAAVADGSAAASTIVAVAAAGGNG